MESRDLVDEQLNQTSIRTEVCVDWTVLVGGGRRQQCDASITVMTDVYICNDSRTSHGTNTGNECSIFDSLMTSVYLMNTL
jgi:hypothetical protein